MKKQELFNTLRNVSVNLARNARKLGRNVQKPRQPGEPGQSRPVSPRDMMEVGRRAAVYLCVLLSCIAVLFASCAKAPDSGDAPPESSPIASPAASPESVVTPAL